MSTPMPASRRALASLAAALLLALAVPLPGLAQQDPAADENAAAAADPIATSPPAEVRSSQEVRNDLSALLRGSPHELATILTLDPTLLSNQAFLAGYPALARFVAANPEVRRNPRYFLAEFDHRVQHSQLGDILEGLTIFCVFGLAFLAAGWVMRTMIEQRRWNRLAKTQSDVHTKILERFGTSEALLEYIRTPAGAKFLEAAPIPVRAEPSGAGAPVARVMWSIQIGVVVAVGALGMILVSYRFDTDSAQDVFALGAIALSVGVGFVVSALVSLFLSRRLGLWQPPPAAEAAAGDDTGYER